MNFTLTGTNRGIQIVEYDPKFHCSSPCIFQQSKSTAGDNDFYTGTPEKNLQNYNYVGTQQVQDT